jgi:hypothetical protein
MDLAQARKENVVTLTIDLFQPEIAQNGIPGVTFTS